MPRKSTASLAVAATALPKRLTPGSDLTADQREIWRTVVNTKPVEWFGADSAPVLAEYCRAVDMCSRLASQIEAAMELGDDKVIDRLLALRHTESKRMADHATKLRLTQQSRYTPQAAATASKKAATSSKPWEVANN
jgi:hypothetical protein